jgi:D-lactate dehydrogenase
MRIILFSSRQYDIETFTGANSRHGYELHFQESHLDSETAVLAQGYEVVCPFVNDRVDAAVLERLYAGGTRMIALRSAGFNHVDLATAEHLGTCSRSARATSRSTRFWRNRTSRVCTVRWCLAPTI